MTKVDTDQTVQKDTVNCHIDIDLNMDKIIEKNLSITKNTEEILAEEIVEKHKTTEGRILEEDIEVT